VQCPKCREVVTIGESVEPQPAMPPPPAPPSAGANAPEGARNSERDHNRIEALEARVAALEEMLKSLAESASRAEPEVTRPSKLQWVAGGSDQSPEFSSVQAKALVHNLSGIRGQEITICSAAGDAAAHKRAEWFKAIFERAKWSVHGPQEVAPTGDGQGLALAVSSLPVAREAAATYLALKAAGFPAIPVLDPSLASGTESDSVSLSLILDSAKVA
jgi:hypothetical protein